MDAAFRSTRSPYSGTSPTKLVSDKLAPEHIANKAAQAHEKDQVLAAALSEYCRLKDDGTAPAIEEFCRRYPTYHKSIQRMIDVEETLDKLEDIDEVQWPEVGSSFMGFDVLHELGVGAFARVYLASEPALGGRLVAVKVAMFGSDEAETLGKLVHPNVVPVHSVCDDPDSGMTAVCMPYLGSATLSDVIEQVFQDGIPKKGSTIIQAVARREVVGNSTDGLSVAEADNVLRRGSYVDAVVRLGIQMADALVYTHSQGVLHRDLKPSNVLVTPAGQPKLLDFNLSCDVETEVNRLGGTLPYMPPEQIKDVFLRPFEAKPPTDPRSDIFSLGVILYEMFTGELPFGNPPSNMPPSEAGSIYLNAQQLPPRSIQELNPAIESQTAQLIARCIAPNPDFRPANAAVLVAELGHHFSPRRQLRRWSSTNKKTLAAVGLVVMAMLLSLVWHLETRPSRDRRLYNSGLRAMEDKDYYQAIEYFDRASEVNKDEPTIRFARGLCEQARNDHVAARSDFESIGRETSEPIVKEVLAYSFLKSGKGESSLAGPLYLQLRDEYAEGPRVDPKMRLKMEVNMAFADYHLIYALQPGKPQPGTASEKTRPRGNALRETRQILRTHPTCRAAHHIRAKCTFEYLRLGLFDVVDVLQDVETALAMGPSTADLERMRIRLLAMIAKKDPELRDTLIAEIKPRLLRTAPMFEKKSFEVFLKTHLSSFMSTKDQPWLDEVIKRCRTSPERTPKSYIAEAPSEEAIWQHLERPWNQAIGQPVELVSNR